MNNRIHDLVIVGAGTAGCVLAERLSASGQLRILVVEAGGEPRSPFVKVPAGFPKLFRTPLDWAFQTEAQASLGGRRVFAPRGRMLGGCSNMNAQIHHWGQPADFDGWAAAGAAGWGWSEVAPVFRAMESCMGFGDDSRGRDGPMAIEPNRYVNALSLAFVEAARAAGCGAAPDYNGCVGEGAWISQVAHRSGRRFSAFDAYLVPAMRRTNLEVLTQAHTARLLIEDRRAIGIELVRGGVRELHRARLGIVLAAGAFGSPQVLLRSGIGPAGEIGRHAIDPVHESPEVGRNLQDHPLVPCVFPTRRTDTFRKAESIPNLLRYLLLKRGMLASNVAEAFALARTAPSAPAPDLELLFAPLEWRREGLEAPQSHAFTIGVIALAPASRGRVALASADPLAPPSIDPAYLGDPQGADAAVLVAGVKLARRIATTDPLARDRVGETEPGEDARSGDQLMAWICKRLHSVYHPAGTCRMGSDDRAVVDPRLKVQGMRNVWVADASVMPSLPRGHPNAAVAMIAHRAASMIEADC